MNGSCPTCGRPYPQPKTRAPELTPAQLAELPDREVFAYYQRTAPRKDVEFFLANCEDGDLRTRATDLLADIIANGGKHTPATKAAYRHLHQAWRAWRDAVELFERDPRPAPDLESSTSSWRILYEAPEGLYTRPTRQREFLSEWGSYTNSIVRPMPAAALAVRPDW